MWASSCCCPQGETVDEANAADTDQIESRGSFCCDFLIHHSCREEVDMDGQTLFERFAGALRCLA